MPRGISRVRRFSSPNAKPCVAGRSGGRRFASSTTRFAADAPSRSASARASGAADAQDRRFDGSPTIMRFSSFHKSTAPSASNAPMAASGDSSRSGNAVWAIFDPSHASRSWSAAANSTLKASTSLSLRR